MGLNYCLFPVPQFNIISAFLLPFFFFFPKAASYFAGLALLADFLAEGWG